MRKGEKWEEDLRERGRERESDEDRGSEREREREKESDSEREDGEKKLMGHRKRAGVKFAVANCTFE